MQRFGPPPSYPNLRIRGLNAPIPSGAQFGYHPGGWGKPPVDQHGVPLYGDVFGTDVLLFIFYLLFNITIFFCAVLIYIFYSLIFFN
jgi:hypothetical protein